MDNESGTKDCEDDAMDMDVPPPVPRDMNEQWERNFISSELHRLRAQFNTLGPIDTDLELEIMNEMEEERQRQGEQQQQRAAGSSTSLQEEVVPPPPPDDQYMCFVCQRAPLEYINVQVGGGGAESGDGSTAMGCAREVGIGVNGGQAENEQERYIGCPACGMRIDVGGPRTITIDELFAQLIHLCDNHGQLCPGHPLFTYESHMGLLLLCSACDACEVIG
ncbi:hypothetical protein HK104_007548 [Borealophlyctis nickersoniae]|nr:hypothetical protein HK104_007548 [Borealophlyctis nickersoniae]